MSNNLTQKDLFHKQNLYDLPKDILIKLITTISKEKDDECNNKIKIIQHEMLKYDMEICACGGVHYTGKPNYYAFRCLSCSKLFCDHITYISDNEDISEIHQKIANQCLFIHCDFETCRTGYCEACYEQKSPMPGCETCGVSWCCRDHMTCEC
jgi:hypothetical protein